VIATGVSADGRREVLGCAVGDSETEDFWTEFLRGLRDRGLGGVQLAISDHHRGPMNARGAGRTGCRPPSRSAHRSGHDRASYRLWGKRRKFLFVWVRYFIEVNLTTSPSGA
jgi:hypothetical protein